ncbi:hypothetical protein T458_23770 [Brevibacillus panacihumi W25]|uniref:Uncharacterized protein n=1 Tax=Brevibacillus panacihumi W25 TaxID=1408254 RepID=V6M7X7_9BACL|nr:hypothetical protein T458_23770 [Brevibacillus panacihumi W25]
MSRSRKCFCRGTFFIIRETRNSWSRKKGKNEGIWDLDQAGTRFQRPTLKHVLEVAAFGRGSAFGVEAASEAHSEDPNPPGAFFPFSSAPLQSEDHEIL